MPKTVRASDWDEFFFIHRHERPRPKKSEIAAEIGMTSQEFSKALDPQRYNPAVTDKQAEAIARLWNQPITFVREIYPRRKDAAA